MLESWRLKDRIFGVLWPKSLTPIPKVKKLAPALEPKPMLDMRHLCKIFVM